jgi:tripartite-type tricarboxylate transporter receptor subunit TctC
MAASDRRRDSGIWEEIMIVRMRIPAAGAAALLALAGLSVTRAGAQSTDAWPAQTLRIVVGVAPGGLLDIYSRLLTPLLQEKFGQPVIVENRPGSGGLIATRGVAEAKPDGYTLVTVSSGTLPSALMHNPPPYSIANFAPVAPLLDGGSFIGVRAGIPVTTFQELVAYGKANPGKLRYGSSGVGSPTHLSLQYLADEVGIDMTHVPYRGNVQAVQALLQQEVDIMVVNAVGFEKQIAAGEIKVVAQSSSRKIAGHENVPSLSDVVPGFSAPFWMGLFAPAGTPREIVGKLNAAVNAAVSMAAYKDHAAKTNLAPMPMTPEQFTDYVKKDTERWAAVIRKHNIKAE